MSAAIAGTEPEIAQPRADAGDTKAPPEEIAFAARLVERPAGQDGRAGPAAAPGPPAQDAGASSKDGSIPFTPEASAQPGPARQGTTQPSLAPAHPAPADAHNTNPAGNPAAGDAAPLSQISEHPAQEDRSLPREERSSASPAAAGHHAQGQEAGFVPPLARAPQPETASPSAAAGRVRTTDASSPVILRGSGAAPPDTPATGTARDIALRLSADDKSAVEVRLSERGGEVRVAVRSADPQMAESMRARLPELVDRLGARGFETEIWRPQQTAGSERGGTNPHPESRGEHGGEPSHQREGGQPRRDEAQPEWVEEFETGFGPILKKTGA